VPHVAQRIDESKSALDDGHPVAISVPVYDNWYSNPATHRYGFIPMPLPMSALKGGHAVVAAAYDYDPESSGGGCFIIRNSWGMGWGPSSPIEAGYGVLPFAYLAGYGWEAFGLTPV
jgi:C1A family cysteine protease